MTSTLISPPHLALTTMSLKVPTSMARGVSRTSGRQRSFLNDTLIIHNLEDGSGYRPLGRSLGSRRQSGDCDDRCGENSERPPERGAIGAAAYTFAFTRPEFPALSICDGCRTCGA